MYKQIVVITSEIDDKFLTEQSSIDVDINNTINRGFDIYFLKYIYFLSQIRLNQYRCQINSHAHTHGWLFNTR